MVKDDEVCLSVSDAITSVKDLMVIRQRVFFFPLLTGTVVFDS
jgi:hypothetical protein